MSKSLPKIYTLTCPICKEKLDLIHDIGDKILCPMCDSILTIQTITNIKHLIHTINPEIKAL